MGNISKITLPDSNTYDIRDAKKSGIYTVIGTQTASTGSWTGALHGVSALYDGLTIMYYLPYAPSGNATLNLTLDNGTTTGAVNCYYSTSRLTTHYGKGSNIVMTYYSAGSIKIDGTATTDNRWIANANYADGNNTAYTITDYYNKFKTGANKIFPYTIVMQCADGRWESIVTSSTIASTKARNTHGFRLGQIALMYYDATYNENDIVGDNRIWEEYTLIDHRRSFNTENNSTKGTIASTPVYLVGAINASDGLFYLDTTWWTQTLPTSADGKLYIHIGVAYDYYRMSFTLRHPVYCYTNGKIRQYSQDAGTVNGLTVQTAVPANAKFTDTTYSLGRNSESVTLTPTGGTAQSVTLSSLINGLSLGASPAQGDDYLVAQYAGGGTTTTSYHRRAVKNIVNATNVKAALGTDTSTTTQFLNKKGEWSTPVGTTYTGTSPISVSGTTISHANSGVTAGTYKSVTVNATGHIIAGTNPTTLAGYGITDANKEANLKWGGKNFTGDYGCIDAAMVGELGANRLAIFSNKASGITVEYTRDGGTTWLEYDGLTNADKAALFNGIGVALSIGKADATHKATEHGTDYQLRVTIDTGTSGIYTVLNKFVLYITTQGSNDCTCQIQKALESTPTTFVDHTEPVSITGWSGYNVINCEGITTYGNKASTQYGRIRFIFKANGGSTNYTGLRIGKIFGFGGVGWTTPSTLAKTGHMYTYGADQSVTFPANLKMNSNKQVGYLTETPTSGKIVITDGTAGGIKASSFAIPTIVTGTLIAGQTSITFTNSAITTNSTFEFFTDKFGVVPVGATVSNGSIVLTFTAQSSNLGVKIKVT